MANLIFGLLELIVCYLFSVIYSLVVVSYFIFAFIFTGKFWVVKDRTITKCLQDKVYGEHKYATVNNVKLHYVENGDPTKPLILFLHGFPEFWYSWRHQIKEFSKDYWTVAVDLRGYADSEKPTKISDYEIDVLVEDVKELVKHLGREKFILISHDWGSVISFRFITKYMNMVDKYVNIGAASIQVMKKLVQTNLKQFTMSGYVFFFQMPLIPEIFLGMQDLRFFDYIFNMKSITKEDIEAYKYIFSQKDAFTAPLNYYRANAKFLTSFAHLKRPTKFARGLYILGEKDTYISKKSGRILQQYYEDLEFKVVKDTGHHVQQENPLETNKLIREFLESN